MPWLAEECGLPTDVAAVFATVQQFLDDLCSLPFESPEQENTRLREENARLRRLLATHSIPIPQLAPEKPTSNQAD
jgi:hypothetical protein